MNSRTRANPLAWLRYVGRSALTLRDRHEGLKIWDFDTWPDDRLEIDGRYAHRGGQDGVPFATLKMVELRGSQINGCSFCVDMHTRELRKAGESDERIATVAAWRDAPWFSDAERAALP